MKYAINSDFKKLKLLTFPVVKEFAPVAEKVLGVLIDAEHSNSSVDILKFKITSENKKIKCLLYSPKNSNGNLPLLVYYHGGGFIYKAAPYHYKLVKDYCVLAKCRVLVADYRNTPGNRFPEIFNDCYNTLKWAVKNSFAIRVIPEKIAVAGDSAGGCLAAATVLKARDEKLVNLCGQMLVYPVLDSRMSSKSMKNYSDTPVWNSKLNAKMWQLYKPQNMQENEKAYYSPALENDFKNLPKTYIQTAEYDCLHDEGVEYANAIKNAGNDVELCETKGTVHGFEMALNSKITEKAVLDRVRFLKEIFNC